MIKREITFQTLEEPPRTITEAHYFSLTAPEFMSLNPDIDPNTKPEDLNLVEFIARADDIVLTAYGVKSEDGMEFKKSKKLRKKFKDSLAYNALVDELFGDDTALTIFISQILPAKLGEGFQKAISEAKTELKIENVELPPPTPPAPPVPPTS